MNHSDKLPGSAVAKENRERVDNFARAIVTEIRLEQGWEYLGQKDTTGTGAFLKWIVNDCMVEEKRKMEELDIIKTKLSPAIAVIAKLWFVERIKEAGRKGV